MENATRLTNKNHIYLSYPPSPQKKTAFCEFIYTKFDYKYSSFFLMISIF